MKRYIKVNGNWIDTLLEQLQKNHTYIVIDGYVTLMDEDGNEDIIGRFEGESDE